LRVLSLVAVSAVVAFLLRRFARLPRETSSWALWLATIWYARCASRSISYWFAPRGSEGSELLAGAEGAYDVFFMVGVAGLAFSVLTKRSREVFTILAKNRLLIGLFIYMGASIAWSEMPLDSTKRYLRAIGDLIAALVIASERNPFQAFISVLRRTVIILVPLSLVLIRYFPEHGKAPSKHWEPDFWVGVATHKNTLGQLLMLVSVFLVWAWLSRERDGLKRDPFYVSFLLGYGVITGYLFYGGGHSQSSTSMLAAAAAIGLFLLLSRSRSPQSLANRLIIVGIAYFLILTPVSYGLAGESPSNAALRLLGKSTDLTGRTTLWEDCLEIGLEQPLLGAGYGGFWTREVWERVKERNLNGPEQSHNGYIEVFLHLGLFGLALFTIVILQCGFRIWRLSRAGKVEVFFCFALFLALLIHNYAEAGFPRQNHAVWFTFLTLLALVARLRETIGLLGEQAQDVPATARLT
jgi:exopolysaccharide production protein ExoQ